MSGIHTHKEYHMQTTNFSNFPLISPIHEIHDYKNGTRNDTSHQSIIFLQFH